MYANMYGISQVSEIVSNLFLTSVYGATKENIIRKNVSLLINSAQELPKQDIAGVESIKLFLDDTPYALINVYFDRLADKMHEHLTRGGRVLVHCMLGVSRSTSLVLAYLMKYKNMSLKSAYDLAASRRPCARPNPGFWRQLVDYEKKLASSYQSKSEIPIPISIASSSRSRPASAARYPSAGPARRYSAQSSRSPFETNTNTTSAILTYLNNTRSPQVSHKSSLYVNPDSRYLQKSSDFITTYRSSYGKFM
ncbi:dual specificity phosphatase [Brachionus plicatilis]|uniref:Dual specificity phosphatase n=1 Tax=Brachionus plicatilis TaxID=10195 RepID=A0A3M7SNT1_BRAPC|nr:dual specificity phosphatase [Brachionus plicatilis]